MKAKFEDILQKDGVALDSAQRAAVFSDQSTVVKAGAGSGKTTVLAYRFLRLVLEGKADADRILTLTYTKKAAAEMGERIYMRLLAAGDKAQLDKFADASISTLDSFFLEVVRSDSVRYGLLEDFGVEEEDEAASTYARLARRVLQRRSGGGGAQRLAAFYSPDELVKLFVELGRDWFTLDRRYDADSWNNAFETEVGKIFHQRLEAARTAAKGLDGWLRSALNIGRVDRALGLMAALAGEDEAPEAAANELATLKVDGRKEMNPESKTLRDNYNSSLLALCEAAEAKAWRKGQKEVFELLCEYQDEVLASKRATQKASFLDISRMALDILRTNKAIRRLYKDRFSHIMIDEFQDNNSLQKDILYLLAERLDQMGDGVPRAEDLQPGKLFFVGDEKQSIYRFRGADVSVFKALSNEIAGAGGKTISLDTNYRSEPALVDEFNRIFPLVMRNEGEGFEADFERLGSRAATSGLKSRFSYCVLLDEKMREGKAEEDKEAREKAEAGFIAELVEKLVGMDRCLVPGKDGTLRRPEFADIAVLYRTLSRQHCLERAFRARDIPYSIQQTRALMLGAVANDLCNVLQLALFPDDRLARLGFLRSPLCRLSGPDWAKAAGGGRLSGEGERRLLNADGRLGRLRSMVGKSTIARLLEHVWYDWGYRCFLVTNRSNQNFIEQFESLWLLAGSFDRTGRSLSDFLSYVRPLMGRSERLKDIQIMREETSGVRMMSIHKSKGLEFPIVVVFDAGSGTGGNNEGLLCPLGDWPFPRHMEAGKCRNIFWSLQKDLDGRMEAAEAKRLLYVALTRAESHLFVVGSQKKRTGSAALLPLALPGYDRMAPGPVGEGIATLEHIDPLCRRAISYPSARAPMGEAMALYNSAQPWKNPVRARRAGVTTLLRSWDEPGLGGLRVAGPSSSCSPSSGMPFASGAPALGAPACAASAASGAAAPPAPALGAPASAAPSAPALGAPAMGASAAAVAAAAASGAAASLAPALGAPASGAAASLAPALGAPASASPSAPVLGAPAMGASAAAVAAAAASAASGAAAAAAVLPSCPADPVVEERGLFARFGTFCHKVLELAAREGRAPDPRQVQERLEAAEGLGGLSKMEKRAFVQSATMFAENFLSSDFCKTMVLPYRREEEARFFYGMGEGEARIVAEGVVDLLVRTGESLLIVDYKTDRIKDPGFHRSQLGLYKEAVSKTTRLPVRCVLFYLRSGEAVYL